jgi:DNA polymerase (family 10)
LLEQRAAIARIRADLGDALTVLHGIELNIGPGGELDYDAEFRSTFDFCLASVHSHFDLDRGAQTRRVVRAMHDPAVRMIGHLSARTIGSRPPIELDLGAIFDAAEATGTALEVNGSLPRLDISVDTLRSARERKVHFVLTSDAHHVRQLDLIDHARLNAERAGVAPDRVVNTWSPDRLRAWAAGKAA